MLFHTEGEHEQLRIDEGIADHCSNLVGIHLQAF